MNICKSGTVVNPNKFWELQITNEFKDSYFNFKVGWTRKIDHAGFQFLFEVMSFMFDFKIYDSRHWDWDNDCYKNI